MSTETIIRKGIEGNIDGVGLFIGGDQYIGDGGSAIITMDEKPGI